MRYALLVVADEDTRAGSLVLLDCTLRGGGYDNNWDFSETLVSKYLLAMAQSGVPVVKLGLRFLDPIGRAGPNAFTTDAYIDGVEVPESLRIGVMLYAGSV